MKNFEQAYYEHYRTLWALAVKMLGDEPAAKLPDESVIVSHAYTNYYTLFDKYGRFCANSV